MPSKYGKRTRTQIEPRPTSGTSFKMGQFYKSSKQFGPWIKSPSTPTSALYNQPYVRSKTTTDYVHPGPPYHEGGPFTSVSDVRDMGVPALQGYGSYTSQTETDVLGFRKYVGGFGMPIWPTFTVDSILPSLDAWRLLVFNKLKPRLEKANLGVALAEARDFPRMMKSTARSFHEIWKGMGGNSNIPSGAFRRGLTGYIRMSPKKRADEFLNVQFGWIPFLKDLNDFNDVLQNSKDYIADLEKRNNQWEHRKKTLLIQETPEEIIQEGTNQCLVQPTPGDIFCNVSNGERYHWILSSSTFTRVWCTGWFKFYHPAFDVSLAGHDSAWNRVHQNMILAGVRVNPSVIWKATPWTWLADWFGSVGNVVDNVTAAGEDGVVSKDLCLMHHRIQKFTLYQMVNFKDGGPRVFTYRYSYATKQRDVAANPYGFGLLPNQLTGMQWSILAALGLGRTRG